MFNTPYGRQGNYATRTNPYTMPWYAPWQGQSGNSPLQTALSNFRNSLTNQWQGVSGAFGSPQTTPQYMGIPSVESLTQAPRNAGNPYAVIGGRVQQQQVGSPWEMESMIPNAIRRLQGQGFQGFGGLRSMPIGSGTEY